MHSKHKLYLVLACLTLVLAGCFRKNNRVPFEILEESSKALGKIQSVAVEARARYEIYPGLEMSGFIDGVDSSKGPYWIRITVTDKSGKPVLYDFGPAPAPIDSAILNEEVRSSAAFGDSSKIPSVLDGPYVAKRPLVWNLFLGPDPAGFNILIPYPALPKAAAGTQQEANVLIEGFLGTHDNHTPFDGSLPQPTASSDKPDIVTKAVIRYEQPELKFAKFTVGKVNVDPNGSTESHEWDFGLFSARDDRGYPDLMWQLEVDDKYAWQSPIKIHNSLEGDLSSYPCQVWIATYEDPAKLTICFLDWDNENLFNNRHDEIGCWEGEMGHLSSDSRRPTVLKCGDVTWGEVTLK